MRPDPENLIPREEALARLFARWTPKRETEVVPLAEAAGRVLAKDQFAGYDLPVVRASAMDGIAVKSERFADGVPDTSAWKPGVDYVRADTGDDFDDAFDAVIAIENVTVLENGGIRLPENINASKGFNIKLRGTDVRRGALLAAKGTVLTALDIAAIGMGGAAVVPVVKKPRVAFLPTGSELVPVGTPLRRGQNFDTNSLLAPQLLREMGAEPIIHAIVPDDPQQIAAAFNELMETADIVLVNAGTSKGQEDYCARLLAERGEVLFHGVAAVPGRPMSMAIVQGKPVVNLSGPTFAAFYSMDWAVRAMVCRALDVPVPRRHTVQAELIQPLQIPPFFSVMSPIRLEQREDGTYTAAPLPLRGPKSVGAAAALTADAVYVSKLGEKAHAAGETIEAELLRHANVKKNIQNFDACELQEKTTK